MIIVSDFAHSFGWFFSFWKITIINNKRFDRYVKSRTQITGTNDVILKNDRERMLCAVANFKIPSNCSALLTSHGKYLAVPLPNSTSNWDTAISTDGISRSMIATTYKRYHYF